MFYVIYFKSAPPVRSMLGTGHAMAVQNNLDDVYYNTFCAGGVACGGAQTPEPSCGGRPPRRAPAARGRMRDRCACTRADCGIGPGPANCGRFDPPKGDTRGPRVRSCAADRIPPYIFSF